MKTRSGTKTGIKIKDKRYTLLCSNLKKNILNLKTREKCLLSGRKQRSERFSEIFRD